MKTKKQEKEKQKKQVEKKNKGFLDSEIKCSCGAVFYFQSSREKMNIEICSQCHPVYVGKKKIIDTMGRVERFQKRVAAKKRKE